MTKVEDERLRKALQRSLLRNVQASGQLIFPAMPSAVDEFATTVAAVFRALSRACTEPDRVKIREALAAHAIATFPQSANSVVVLSYELDELTDAVNWKVRSLVISNEQQYAEWVEDREPPLFGEHPDAKLLDVARELGDPADVAFLDVGAGTGRNALPMARLGHPTDVVEPVAALSEQLEAAAEEADLQVGVINGDFWDPALRLPKDQYRLVLLSEVCSNLRGNGWIRPLFERLAQVLEPGGVGLFNVFLAEPGFRADPFMREFSEVMWTPFVFREDLVAASADLPIELISEEDVIAYEKARLPTWPPTDWYEGWASGETTFALPPEQVPISLHWLTLRRIS